MSEIAEASEAARPRRRRKAAAAPAVAAEPSAGHSVGQAIELPAELGIEQVASLREQLAAQLASAAPVVLAGAAVSRVHTAGLQLLALFCREREAAGHVVQWREPSPVLAASAETLGLNSLMQIPRNEP